ncbi:MAG: MerR family transcriptional regulator [Oscillospiraceae bacterium]|nr:MerR family transcriptional regulator [Oscillospiraceae bacterium]
MEKNRAIPEGYMRIGEIAKKAGVTVRTLSYYDKEGLLTPSSESESGYRLYTDKDMVKLIQILMLKELGLTLREIKAHLTKLDTPENVSAMLAEQASHVRKKIKILTQSLESIESLNAEIAQIEKVNFKKYADILLNLHMKNEEYQMIKHLDDDVMDMFRELIGREKTALMVATVNDFYKQTVLLIKEAIPPESEKGQAFADAFWKTLMELSGGDSNMMFKISEQFIKAASLVNENKEEQDAVRDYMMRAFGVYQERTFTGTHTGSDKKEVYLKLMDLTNEAFQFHTNGVAPESEEVQKFIKTFWETLLEFTDGNMELIQQMNKQVKDSKFQDNKTEAANRFIESALEIYFKNQTGTSKGAPGHD